MTRGRAGHEDAEMGRAIEAALRRCFVPPAAPVLHLGVRPARLQRRLWTGAAAALVVAALAWTMLRSDGRGAAPDAPPPSDRSAGVGTAWVAAYRDQEAQPPLVGCTVPTDVPEFLSRLSPTPVTPLVCAPIAPVEFEGGLPPDTVPGAGVLQFEVPPAVTVWLIVVPADADPEPILPEGSGLHLFREVQKDLVVYELTPLAEPRAITSLTTVVPWWR